MENILYITAGLAALGLVFALILAFTTLVTVEENEQVFVIQKGVRKGPLDTGDNLFAGRNLEVIRLDTRSMDMQVPGQELPTKDQIAIKVSALARYRITDGERLLDSAERWEYRVYSEVQVALRQVVTDLDLEEVLAQRGEIGQKLEAALAAVFETYGLVLESVQLLDVMLPGDLKRAMSQAAEARAIGKAKLESARAETASLRNLANAAKLLKENSALLDLRTLEVAEQAAKSGGNTLVLGLEGKNLPK